MKKLILIFAGVVFLLSFQTVFAKVVINEVMYNLPKGSGSDVGREWVEVLNKGPKQVDLSTWRFFEGEVNHKIKSFQGNSLLPPNSYAILADNPTKFLIDNSGFKGSVFDTAFSLSNKGETIALKDDNLNKIDSVNYSSFKGANGDGNSLQEINNVLVPATPTPGIANVGTSNSNTVNNNTVVSGNSSSATSNSQKQQQSSNTIQNQPTTVSSNNDVSSWPTEPQIFARIKNISKTVIVGADVLIEGEALGLKKKPLTGARYLWTLGDGGTKEGQIIFYHYRYPGKYVVILNVSSGKYNASDRIEINAIPANLSVSSVGIGDDSFVELQNKTGVEINLSYWRLSLNKQIFTIPKNTIVLKNNKIVFSPQYTKFKIKKGDSVNLLYPNGMIAVSYKWISDIQKNLVVKTPSVIRKNFIKKTVVVSENKKPAKTILLKKQNKKKEVSTKIIPKEQTANVLTVIPNNFNIYWWLLGVGGVSVLAIFGVFLSRKEKPINSDTETVDDYKIIEEE